MGLEEYKDIVATCASVTTIGQMFAGICTVVLFITQGLRQENPDYLFICKDIYKKGTSKGFDPTPFIGGIGMTILMFQYALILEDYHMINVNVVGFLLNVAYMTFYYVYSPDKNDILARLGKAIVFVAIFIGYAQIEHSDNIEFRFGIIVTVLMLILIASPLFQLGEILRTKSTAGLPFPLIFMATLVTFQWLLYGLIIDNAFIINAVAFTLSVAQLSLFAIFSSEPPTDTKSSDPKKEK